MLHFEGVLAASGTPFVTSSSDVDFRKDEFSSLLLESLRKQEQKLKNKLLKHSHEAINRVKSDKLFELNKT